MKINETIMGFTRRKATDGVTAATTYEQAVDEFPHLLNGMTMRQFISRYWSRARGPHHCICGREFETLSGYGRHKKSCDFLEDTKVEVPLAPAPEGTVVLGVERVMAGNDEVRRFLLGAHVSLNRLLDQQVSELRQLLGV